VEGEIPAPPLLRMGDPGKKEKDPPNCLEERSEESAKGRQEHHVKTNVKGESS